MEYRRFTFVPQINFYSVVLSNLLIIYICLAIILKSEIYNDMRSFVKLCVLTLLISTVMAGCNKVEENNPPVITSVTLNPEIVTPSSTAMVEVKATDNDGDLIIYNYIPSAGTIFGTGSIVSWLAPDTAGVYSLIIKASDGSGDYSIDSVSLIVSDIITPTELQGTATFPVGVTGDLSYSRVALYASIADRIAGFPQKSMVSGSGSFSIVNFTMQDITPGDYYIDVWKDNDNSLTYSNGDFLGWYGSGNLLNPQLNKVSIIEGQTTHINIQMYIY